MCGGGCSCEYSNAHCFAMSCHAPKVYSPVNSYRNAKRVTPEQVHDNALYVTQVKVRFVETQKAT